MYSVKSDYDGVMVLSLKGNLVSEEDIKKLEEDIHNAIAAGPKGIVINLHHLNWISSQGIGSIIRCLTQTRKAGLDLYLAGLNDKVQTIVSVMRIDKIIKLFTSVQEAVANF